MSAVALDPYQNIVNVGWGGGILVISAQTTFVWHADIAETTDWATDETFARTLNLSTQLQQRWRTFITTYRPLSGMNPPQIFVPIADVNCDGFPSALPPAPSQTVYHRGAVRSMAWKFDQLFPAPGAAANPDFDGDSWAIRDLPAKMPEAFIPQNLAGHQCGYSYRGARQTNGSFWVGDPPLSITSQSPAYILNMIWTINLNHFPPDNPGDPWIIFRLAVVPNPQFSTQATERFDLFSVQAGMYKPFTLEEMLQQTDPGSIPGEIVDEAGFGEQVGEAGGTIEIGVVRDAYVTEGVPKVQMRLLG